MKKKLLTLLQYVFFLGLGLGLLWYTSKDLTPQQMQELKDSFSQTQFLFIVPVIFALLLSHYSRAIRWRLLIQPLGYNPTRTNLYLSVLIGYFFNLLVPRLGEVMKCTLLGKYDKIPADKLIGTIVAERAVDVVCLFIVILVMLITQYQLLGEIVINNIKKLFEGADLTEILMYSGLTLVVIFIIRYIIHRFAHIHVFRGLKKLGQGIWHGLTSISKIEKPGWFYFHTVIIWGLYLTSIWLGFKAFPLVSHMTFNASVSVLVFGSIGMIATQGGIGAYQLAVQKTLMLYGVSAVAGLGFGWVIWGAQTAIVIVAGLISIIVLPLVNRQKHA